MAYGLGEIQADSFPSVPVPPVQVIGTTVTAYSRPDFYAALMQYAKLSDAQAKDVTGKISFPIVGGLQAKYGGYTFKLVRPPKPTAPVPTGMEWSFYTPTFTWRVQKKSGGILGAIGSVLGTVGKVAATVAPVAALAIPVVGPAVGIGTAAVSGIASASKTIGVAGGALQSAGSALAPSVPPPMVVPQQGGTPVTVPIVPPGQPVLGTMTPGMPSWVVPVGIGVLVFLLSDRGR